MAVSDSSPNTENYFIGKGICYFKKTGETAYRHLGNAPEVEYTAEIETLEHFSSLDGIKVRDLSIVTSQKATIRIVLEEGTAKNWGLALMADPDTAYSHSSSTFITTSGSTALTGVSPTSGLVAGRRYQISGTGVPTSDTMVFNGGSTATLEVAATAAGTVSAAGTISAPIAMSVFEESQITGAFAFKGTNDQGAEVAFEAFAVTIRPNAAVALISEELGSMELLIEVNRDDFENFAQFYWNLPTNWAFV